jgi:hypothetical protein
MSGTGEEVSHLPIQAVVGDALVETQRADLGGLIGEEKASEQPFFQSWPRNGRVIRDHLRQERQVASARASEGRKEVKVVKEVGEAMQGHGIEILLADEEKI